MFENFLASYCIENLSTIKIFMDFRLFINYYYHYYYKWRIQRRGPGGPGSPLFLDQTEAPKARKKFFWSPSPPPPLSLRVRCLALPPLPSPRVPVNMWSEFIFEYRNVVYLYYCNLKFFIQLVKDTLWQVKNIISTMELKTTVKVIFC